MIKSRAFLAAGLLAAGALASCTDEVPAIPASELYTRAWVKEFGVVSASHDWNNATRGEVTVDVEGTQRVKITAMLNGKNYLLGNFADISGRQTLRFDVPRGIQEVTVRAGADAVKLPLGGTASINRSVVKPVGDAGITAELCTEEKDWWVIPFLNATVFRRKLPEKAYNLNRPGVTNDFMFKFTEHDFILRPLFWETLNKLRLGMFYLDENEKPVHIPIYDMEKTDVFSEDLVLSLVKSDVKEVVVDNFTENAGLMKCFADNGVVFDELGVLDNFTIGGNGYLAASAKDDHNVTFACRQYMQDYLGLVNSKTYSDGTEVPEDKRFNYVYRWRFEKEDGAQFEDPYTKLVITYTYFKYGDWTAPTSNNKFGGSDDSANRKNYMSLVTKGIRVHVEDLDREYGFYICVDGWNQGFDNENEYNKDGFRYYYSISSQNTGVRFVPKEGAVRDNDGNYAAADMEQVPGAKTARAATWIGEKYNWRYLSFEDGATIKEGESYNAVSCDFDMQDIVFLIDGVDPHEVVDKDPEPEPEPVRWIVACEDLGSMDDFDFNDVVFEVSHVSGEDFATVTPLAAGGTLPVYLKYWNGSEALGVGGEWHSLFGVQTSVMVNTSGSRFISAEPIRIPVAKDYTIATREDGHTYDGVRDYRDHMGGFFIEVQRADGNFTTVTPPMAGQAPQMFLIFQEAGKKWCWPLERNNIKSSYNKFTDWAGQGEHSVLNAWFDTPTGPVFNRP